MAPQIFSRLFRRKGTHQNLHPPEPYTPEAIGIADSTCEVGGSPYNEWKLPIPPPEQRQLKPTRPRNPQLQIHFFKLPPEVRELIYKELLGCRRVHIDYLFREPFRSLPQSKEQRRHREWWQWYHSVCQRSNSFVGDRHLEASSKMNEMCLCYDLELWGVRQFGWQTAPRGTKIEGIEWMRCCQIGYEEALPILYGSNVFATESLNTPFRLSRLLEPHCASLLTSMDIVFKIPTLPSGPLDLHGNWANVYLAFFELFHHSFRNVRRLRLTLFLQPLYESEVSVADEKLDAFLAPWETLVASREWSQIDLCVPENMFTGKDDWYTLLREKRPEGQRSWTLRRTDYPPPRHVFVCGNGLV